MISMGEKKNDRGKNRVTAQTEKQLTGYPSVDKPWLKYYSEKAIQAKLPKQTMFQYVLRQNRDYPYEIALDYYGTKITYEQFFRNIRETASAFYLRGIRKGDTVTIMSPLIPETIYCIYALNYLGAAANMIYMSMPESQIIEKVERTGSKMLIAFETEQEKIEHIEDRFPGEKILILILELENSMSKAKRMLCRIKRKKRPLYSNMMNWKQFISQGNGTGIPPAADYEKGRIAIIVYTSGSTGEPKGVMLSDDSFNVIAMQYFYTEFPFSRKDSTLCFLPPFLAIGLSLNIHMPLCMGTHNYICPNPDLDHVAKEFWHIRPNHFVAAPHGIIKTIDHARGSMKFCKSIGGGGAEISPKEEKRINEILNTRDCGSKYNTGYGMSEFAATVTLNSNGTYKELSMGVPLCMTVIKVVDPDTMEEKRYNEVGELCFRTPGQMEGYLFNEQATRETMRLHSDGKIWIHTGDLGFVDEDGFVFFKGRIKRIYLSKGEGGTLYKIFPASLEEVLSRHPFVRECAVIVVKDKEYINLQIAYVTLTDQATETDALKHELEIYCREKLPSHMIPSDFRILGKLPMTASGKVDYRKLEALK